MTRIGSKTFVAAAGVLIATGMWLSDATAAGQTGTKNGTNGYERQPRAERPAVPPPAVEKLVSIEQIQQAVEAYVVKRLQGKATDVEVRILSPDEALPVPTGAVEFRVRGRALLENFGRRMFEVTVLVNGREARRVNVLADIEAFADVLTATRTLKPQDVIEAGDVDIARVSLPSESHDFVTDADLVVGKEVAKPIKAESPVRMSSLVVPDLIRRGDQVMIEVKHGGLVVHAIGTTKNGGQLGQPVIVTNLDSKKDLRAIVVGPGTVRVEF